MINSFFTRCSSLKVVNQFYNVSRIDAGGGTPDTPQNKTETAYTQNDLTALGKKFYPDNALSWKLEQTAASREGDALNFLANAGMLERKENPTPDLNPEFLANASVIELPNPKESPKLDDRLLANAGVLKPVIDNPDLPDEIIA